MFVTQNYRMENLEKKISGISNWFLSRPKTSGFIVFSLFFIVLNLSVFFKYQISKENEEHEMLNMLNVIKKNIEQTFKNNYAALITLALSIDDSGEPKNFEKISQELFNKYENIDVFQLVPNGVIKYTYPLKGNEAVVNFNILKDPLNRVSALKAINTKTPYFSGPLKLKQGGLGVIGRLPIYKKDKFWGFSAVVLKYDSFIKSTGIVNFKSDKYYLQLSKVNPLTHKIEFFLENQSDFSNKKFKEVYLPEADLKLYIILKNNSDLHEIIPLIILAFLFSLLSGLLTNTLLKRPAELQRLLLAQKAKIEESELLFKSIFEHAGLGIVHTDSSNGKFLYGNDKFCELIGYNHDEIKDIDFMRLTHPEDLPNDSHHLEELRKGNIEQYSLEKRLFHKSGKLVWIRITVSRLSVMHKNLVSHIAIIEDISCRKEAEFESLKSKKKINDIIDSIDGVVWEGNLERPGVSFVSKKSEIILGYTPEEWLNDPFLWRKMLHPEDKEWEIAFTDQNAKSQEPIDFEYRLIHKKGNVVWVRDIVSVYHEEENTKKFRGILIDITKSKQFELDLNNSLQLVTEQNKRLLNFSHIVSHNLRSHTSNIESLIDLIEITEEEQERKELMELLKSVSKTLNQTMDNLNQVVSIQTDMNTVLEKLNLNQYIKKTIEVLRHKIIKNDVSIINNVSNETFVKFNPAYLESILLNFFSNAIRYRHPDRKPQIILDSYIENNYIVLEIKDNGIGIDLKKNGDKLFGLYKTFTSYKDSKGVGLFITKNQIDAMKGRVEVESVLDIGSNFKIYFNNATEENLHHR